MLKIELPAKKNGTQYPVTNPTSGNVLNAASASGGPIKKKMLVGLCGFKGSGKSTLVAHNLRVGLRPAQVVSFASPIKKALHAMGVPWAALINAEDKNFPLGLFCGKTGRQLQQSLGTEWGRDMVGPDLWIRLANDAVTKNWGYELNVIIDDVRFDDEAKYIKDNGGIIIHVVRANHKGLDMHRSEAGINPTFIDMEFVNDGDWDAMVDRIGNELAPKIKLAYNAA